MVLDVRYITDEAGERVAFLLDLATYHRLTAARNDSELLTGLSHDELVALAESALSLATQNQLHDLLSRNAKGELLADDVVTLDQLLARVDDLDVLKTRARYTLEHLSQIMRAEAFDQKFDEGQEDIVDDLDLSRLRRPGREQRRIDENTKELHLHSHEQTHLRNLQ